MTYTGDRAIFPLTNHRLDKVNLLLIAELMQQQLVREKAVYGPTWGALTALTGTWSSPNFTFDACLLFQCYPPSGSLVPEGRVVVFDPLREAQATASINLAAYVANDRTLLWFKREETDTHDDNQAHWPVNVEVLTTSKTRTSEYVAFEATNSNVDGTDVDAAKPSISVANGWFPFASVSWSAGVPTIHPIHPMDGGLRKNSSTGALANGILFQHDPLGGGAGYGMSESENIGLYRAVREVVNQIMEIKDQSSRFGLDGKPTTLGALSWRAHPTRSLNTINTDLATAEASVVDHESRIDDLETVVDNLAPRAIYAAYVAPNASLQFSLRQGPLGPISNPDGQVTWVKESGNGHYSVEFTNNTGISSAVVTPLCQPIVNAQKRWTVYWETVRKLHVYIWNTSDVLEDNYFSLVLSGRSDAPTA